VVVVGAEEAVEAHALGKGRERRRKKAMRVLV